MTDENAAGWSSVGRSLAQAQLESQAEATSHALRQAARGARDGDLSAAELRRCYDALEDAELLLDEIAAAVDGIDRPPRLGEKERDAVLGAVDG